MNKLFKTLSLVISIISAIPVAAIEPNEVKVGDVVGTIGGNITRIEESGVIGTMGEPVAQMAVENTEKKNESKLQRLCNFLSKNKIKLISYGLLSALLLYRIFYVHLPEIHRLKQETIELQAFNESLKEFVELVKNTTPNLTELNS